MAVTFIDPRTDPGYRRSILNAIVAPRPIGWMSTVDPTGRANLAPFSYFAVASSWPPILSFSCNRSEPGKVKDTAANILRTGEFVYNLVSRGLAEQMNATSSMLPPDGDEFDFAGLAKAACLRVKPPRVAAAPASLECRLLKAVVFGDDDDPHTRGFFAQ